jgi:hypothetical protein
MIDQKENGKFFTAFFIPTFFTSLSQDENCRNSTSKLCPFFVVVVSKIQEIVETEIEGHIGKRILVFLKV